MVLKQGMILAGSGVVIGLLVSLVAGKPTATMVGGHASHLPLVALVTIALLAMAGLGVYLPARRASLVDPNTVLRQE
jgi:ABC-type antimicrobial peptide transport system permease subunit